MSRLVAFCSAIQLFDAIIINNNTPQSFFDPYFRKLIYLKLTTNSKNNILPILFKKLRRDPTGGTFDRGLCLIRTAGEKYSKNIKIQNCGD